MRPHIELAEQELARTGIALAALSRIAALEADLIALQSAPPAARDDLAPAKSPAFSIGCYYVVEGSSLGGRVLHRQLDYLLGGAEGRTFFHVADSDRWRRVCAAVERHTVGAPQLDDMIAGARAAFTCFEHHLREHCNVS